MLTNTETFLNQAITLLTNRVIPIVFILATLYFFWGIVKYIKSEGAGKAEGKAIMVWGVVALFVMTSVWGIVRLLRVDLLSGQDTNSIQIPTATYGTTR